MPTEKFVRANPDEVAAKVVQGEAIIINLATGVYYSMTGVGAAAWGSSRLPAMSRGRWRPFAGRTTWTLLAAEPRWSASWPSC